MKINEISGVIVDEAIKLHEETGPGLLESVYETLLATRLARRGLKVVRQAPITFQLDGISFEDGLRADLLVADEIIVELKSTEQNHPIHAKQVITYLRLSGKQLGLVLNFGMPLLKDGIKRLVNNLSGDQK